LDPRAYHQPYLVAMSRTRYALEEAPNVSTRPKLRIAYTVPSERFGVFLPLKSSPDNSRLYRALESGDVESAEERWSVVGMPVCRVDAIPMPDTDDFESSARAVAFLDLRKSRAL
jgi:hypothetical protein